MSLKLSKTNTPAYDYLSEDGAMTNPAVASVAIDKTGGTKTSPSVTLYLVAVGSASIGSYNTISITPSTATTGITWEMSLNGSTWTSSISPGNMDCESADVVTTCYARIVANNAVDSPLTTGNFAAEFDIAAIESPPAV